MARRPGLLAFACVLAAGCVGPSPDLAPPAPGRETALPLALEQRVVGELDCAAGACLRWYRIEQPRAGELQVDVLARGGPNGARGADAADLDVRLENDRGELLWAFAPPAGRVHNVRRVLGPGTYHLLLRAVDERAGPLSFEIVARVVAREPPLPQADMLRAAPKPGRSAAGPELWVHAEIVRVEGRGDLPSFVVLDAGSRDDLRLGLSGELLERGEAIAAFELVEVGDRSSRARLLAPPTAAITYATRARVRVPVPGPR